MLLFCIVPLLSSSHHQDCYFLSKGSPKTFICHYYEEGGQPNQYTIVKLHFVIFIFYYTID